MILLRRFMAWGIVSNEIPNLKIDTGTRGRGDAGTRGQRDFHPSL